jgi:hypothetical protein
MSRNAEIILACMEANVASAKTKAMRAFAEKQLADFKDHLDRTKKAKPQLPPSISKFLDLLETQN